MFSYRTYLILVLFLLPQTIFAQDTNDFEEKSTRWLSNRAEVLQRTTDRLDQELQQKTQTLENTRVELETKRIQLEVLTPPEPPEINEESTGIKQLKSNIEYIRDQLTYQEKRISLLNNLLKLRSIQEERLQQVLHQIDRLQQALSELRPLLKTLKDRIQDDKQTPDSMPEDLSWEQHAIHQLRSETKKQTFLEEQRQGKQTRKTLREQLQSATTRKAKLTDRLREREKTLERARRIDQFRTRYRKMNRKALHGKAKEQLDVQSRKLARLQEQVQELKQLREQHKRQFQELNQLNAPGPDQPDKRNDEPEIGTSARKMKRARARLNFRRKRKKKLSAIQETLNKEESLLAKATATRRQLQQATEELTAIKSVLANRNAGSSKKNQHSGPDLDTLETTVEQEQKLATQLDQLRHTLHEDRNRLKSRKNFDRAMAFHLSNYDQLPLAYLRPRARTLRDVVDSLRSELEEMENNESRRAEEIESLKARLGALQEPSPINPSESIPVWEETQLKLEAKNKTIQVVRERKDLLKKSRSLMEERLKLLRSLREKGMQLGTALEALKPILAELEERMQEGRLDESDLQSPPDLEAYRRERKKLNRQLSEWNLALNELPASRQYVETMQEDVKQRLTKLQKELENLERRRDEALKRKTFYQKHKGKDAQTLSGLLERLDENWSSRKEAFDSSNTLYQQKLARIEELEESVETLKQPSADEITVDEKLELLKQTARELKLAKKRHQFYRKRSALYQDLKEQYESLLQQLEEAGAERKEEYEVLQELKAVISLLLVNNNEQPVSQNVDPEQIQERIATLNERRASFIDRRKQYQKRLSEIEQSISADRKMVNQLQNNIHRLEEKLNDDREWANWTRKVQQLKTPELIERFRKAEGNVEEARKKVASVQEEANNLRKKLKRSRNELHQMVNPKIRNVRLKSGDFRDQFLSSLKQFPDSKLNVRFPPQSDQKQSLSPELPETLDGWQDRYSERRRRWSGQLQYLDQREKLRSSTVELMKKYRSRLQSLRKTVDQLLKKTRVHWGSAYMIQVRESRENLENQSIPDNLKEAAKRKRLTRIESRRQQIDRNINNLEHRISLLEREATVEESLKTEIQKQFDLFNRQIKVVRKLQQKKEELQGNGENESKLEKEDVNARIETMIDQSRYWYEPFISLFSSEQVEKLREQLRFLLGKQLNLEGKLQNLKTTKELAEQLIDFSQTRKSYSTELEPVLNNLLELRQLKKGITYTKIKSKLGARNSDVLASRIENEISEYNNTHGTSIEEPVLPQPLPDEQRKSNYSDLADELFDASTGTRAYRNWLTTERRKQNRLEGGIEVNAWQDRIAGIAAKQAELEDSLAQLTGPANEPPSSGTDSEPSTDERDPDQSVPGEIATTRNKLRTQQLWASGQSIFFILIIPLFAFGVLRAFDYTGELLLERWKRSDDEKEDLTNKEQREREERRKTLFQVLSAAFNITVVILAFIYLLKALNIDVTPLIASVGVLGLAVAFGAQPLFRDFFAGFFILLEDQYKMGDFVDLDGTEGTVERMNLRLTLLRARDGTLHYIPNGTIDQVSNRTKDWAKITMSVGVGYDDDIDHVISTLEDIGEEMMEDEQFKDRVNEVSVPGVDELAGSSVNIAFHLTVRPRQRWQIAREVRRIIKLRFDEEGIDIPYKHVVIHNE